MKIIPTNYEQIPINYEKLHLTKQIVLKLRIS